MKKLGFICLTIVIVLFITLALDLQNFGVLTYGLGLIFIILSAFFFAKARHVEE